MFLIIIGAGRTGRAVLESAVKDYHEIVVIEQDASVAEEISMVFDCTVIHADATSLDVLRDAGAKNADVVLATTHTDSVNLMCLMLAKELGVKRLVSSVSEDGHISVFRQLGISIVESPFRLNGRYLYRSIQYPGIRDFIALGCGAEVVEIVLSSNSKLVGRSLAEINAQKLLPQETLFVAIVRDQSLIIPKGDVRLKASDHISILVMERQMKTVLATIM